MQFQIEKPLIIIAGPTAVGKTEISIRLAEEIDGEIISADSRLLYRGLNIGTAKPSLQEQSRIKHHLIDVSEIDDHWSLAVFQERVYQLADEIRSKGKIPLLVGGTGQYIRAIIEGWIIPEQEPDLRIRSVIQSIGESIGAEKLHEKLQIVDPAAANKIEPMNLRRTIRAFEVIFSTGKLFSQQKGRSAIDFNFKLIGLSRNREELYKRIDQRIDNMFRDGLVSEVEKILEKGYARNLPSLTAIGYKEVIDMLYGEIDMDEAVRLMKRRTRQYVRRQANWFKKDDPKIKWFNMEPDVIEKIKSYILSPIGWKNE
jgi:tRNA dimethylallyltransferase